MASSNRLFTTLLRPTRYNRRSAAATAAAAGGAAAAVACTLAAATALLLKSDHASSRDDDDNIDDGSSRWDNDEERNIRQYWNALLLPYSLLSSGFSYGGDSNNFNNNIGSNITHCQQQQSPPPLLDEEMAFTHRQKSLLRTRQTVRRLEQDSSKYTLESRYNVDWKHPLGQGSFGVVYLGQDIQTKERVAVKKISKKFTNEKSLQLELNALLHLRSAGGHPHICSLHETFSEGDFYYVVLDLIEGGEMFDHLVSQGAYSEADAARIFREVASALAFLHDLSVVHCDLKPENLMLSTPNPSDAVIKLIDFGCAIVSNYDDDDDDGGSGLSLTGRTLAYCPAEVLDQSAKSLDPSADMWALGVILYIMLTGIHPYDLSGQATDEQVAHAIVRGTKPPIRDSPITAHLSESSLDLMEQLMQQDPRLRLTADEALNHPWARGETASQDIMVGSDKRLKLYRKFKSGLEKKVFENFITWSDDSDNSDTARKASLIERAFRKFDSKQKGYLDPKDLKTFAPKSATAETEDDHAADDGLTLSGFSDLLSENMKNVYFPRGTTIYKEGQEGHKMYVINSGTVSVETNAGSCVKRGPGDFFGEGALLHPKNLRSATIKCDTAVHAIEINRDYFDKWRGDSDLLLTLQEKDKIRKRNRAKMILRLQKELELKRFKYGDAVFRRGNNGDCLFLVESGKVRIENDGQHVFTATPSNVFGEYSLIFGQPRNCDAFCDAKQGCFLHQLSGSAFRKLTATSPEILSSLRDLCLRRDFKKAVVLRLKKEFPYDNPREAFDAVAKTSRTPNALDAVAVGDLMRQLDPHFTDEEIKEIIAVMDLKRTGTVTFDEFKKVFIADIRKSASI